MKSHNNSLRGTIILICGKIASGKSYYAKKLLERRCAVLFSMDELFEICEMDFYDDLHSELYPRLQRYLYAKAAELSRLGIDVIMDSGFWTVRERNYVSKELSKLEAPFEWHYIDISDDDWERNIEERNAASSEVELFIIDEHKKREINAEFEIPNRDEIDVWILNQRDDS